jgi:hypothetical protein
MLSLLLFISGSFVAADASTLLLRSRHATGACAGSGAEE